MASVEIKVTVGEGLPLEGRYVEVFTADRRSTVARMGPSSATGVITGAISPGAYSVALLADRRVSGPVISMEVVPGHNEFEYVASPFTIAASDPPELAFKLTELENRIAGLVTRHQTSITFTQAKNLRDHFDAGRAQVQEKVNQAVSVLDEIKTNLSTAMEQYGVRWWRPPVKKVSDLPESDEPNVVRAVTDPWYWYYIKDGVWFRGWNRPSVASGALPTAGSRFSDVRVTTDTDDLWVFHNDGWHLADAQLDVDKTADLPEGEPDWTARRVLSSGVPAIFVRTSDGWYQAL